MAKVTFMGGIATISGKLGDLIYRTTPTGKTIAYKAPQRTFVNLHQRKSIIAIGLHWLVK